MKIFINTFGSRGDVQPYVALGKALKAKGHTVMVCTGSRFETLSHMQRPSPESSVAPGSELDRNKLHDSLRRRVVITEVQPSVDRGRFPIKRTVGERVEVTTVIIADGHDLLTGVLKYRDAGSAGDVWHEATLEFVGNDRWRASFVPTTLGTWEYTVEAWVDKFATWQIGRAHV